MQDVVEKLLEQGTLVSPSFLRGKTEEELATEINQPKKTTELFAKQLQKTTDENKHKEKNQEGFNVEIIKSYVEKNKKINYSDFVNLYNTRYLALQRLLRQRQEQQGATTISKANLSQERENVSFIAAVFEKKKTKNNNLLLKFEDQTGTIKAIVMNSKKEIFEIANDLALDEVVGIQGTKGNNIIFVNSIIHPDVPLNKELKKTTEEEAAIFISDIHLGSKSFLKKSFEKFINWVSGETGTEAQKKEVEKIKYLFILGDLVEGIGVYPNQDKELYIKDLYKQYDELIVYLKKIPAHIAIIICPGNHDGLRIAEPQPPHTRDLFREMFDKDNLFFVSSPSTVRIGKTHNFSGFDVLLYHGYSFPHYADKVDALRLAGGLENTENIMKYLLKRRHLAPTHGSTRYQLGYSRDPLLINEVPDFFVTGHVHRASITSYRNVTLLNCSCWISQTDYQEKRGLVPQPARAIYVDLKTRKPKILNFLED